MGTTIESDWENTRLKELIKSQAAELVELDALRNDAVLRMDDMSEDNKRLALEINELRSINRPVRHELQQTGSHPTPCAKFCEATAFNFEIQRLKALCDQLGAALEEAMYSNSTDKAILQSGQALRAWRASQ